jgi:ABC-type Na+ efflux pump permease subunit
MQPLEFEVVNDASDRNSREAFFLSLVLLMLIYGMIIFYGTLVMRGVIEEKQSRIIEVLLSSVKPFQLMLGKLIGIGLVSLTQMLLWAASAILLSTLAALPMFAASVIQTAAAPTCRFSSSLPSTFCWAISLLDSLFDRGRAGLGGRGCTTDDVADCAERGGSDALVRAGGAAAE